MYQTKPMRRVTSRSMFKNLIRCTAMFEDLGFEEEQ
jgi:hypothetical protein